jgi:hypothetical protein
MMLRFHGLILFAQFLLRQYWDAVQDLRTAARRFLHRARVPPTRRDEKPNKQEVVELGGFDRLQNRLQWIFSRLKGDWKLLKKMVGERGFEPPTPWSRIAQAM